MSEQMNARGFSRSPVHIRAEVRLPSGVLLEGQVRNVSMSGIWFAMERALPIGNPVKLDLVLDTGKHEQRIQTHGKIARVDEGGVAIQFEDVDLDSLPHLQQLVRYNAANVEKVEKEFASHIGLRPRE